VPTIRYVWTSSKNQIGDIVANPYFPIEVRNIVVRAGRRDMRKWMREKRDIVSDFERAFGRLPDKGVSAVAIFTDNDQTKESVMAYYQDITLECN